MNIMIEPNLPAATATLPGTYHDVDNEVYHRGPGVSNSGLRNLARSPFHFYSLHLDPNRPKPTVKPGQLEGTLAHCTILEPLQFANRYVCGPAVRANTNEWKAFAALHNEKQVIHTEQYETARAQALSVRRLPDVAELLSRGHAEVSAYWHEPVTDPATGEINQVLCRIRPDWVHPVNDDSVILLDVKTFSDASPQEFARQIRRKSYHCQNAFYKRGYEKATGKKVLAFVFAAVETNWPFAASAVMLDEGDVAAGDAQNKRLLQVYARCVSSNTWPSYSDAIVPVSIPNYSN